MKREGIPDREKLPLRERIGTIARTALYDMATAGAPMIGVVTLEHPVYHPHPVTAEAEFILFEATRQQQ